MQNNVYTYLKFVLFRNLENWSVSHLLGKDMEYTDKYSIVSIGDIIDKCQCPTKIKDNTQYKQITLKTNGGGAVLRGIKWGKDIRTKKQYIALDGQFIMSKIDARNGAFGIITKDLDGAVVTSDFPLFNVDTTKIIPEYLALIASTKKFVQFAQSCSRGTTNRQRIDMNLFLSQQIPLPSLSEQKAIVSAYENKIQEAATLEDHAIQVEHNIDNYLLSELGITHNGYKMSEPPTSIASEPQVEYNASQKQGSDMPASHHWTGEKKKEYKYLKFVRFKNIERWDCYIFKSMEISKLYKNGKLFQIVVSKPQYGAGYSSKEFDGNIRYIRITDINDDGTLTANKVSADGYSEQYLLKNDDFLIARSGNTVGKTFLYKEKVGKAIYAGYLIRFELNTDLIIPEYLLYYTKCSIYKKWISGNMRVSAQPNINSQQYLDSPVVLPPIVIQKTIVEHINKQKLQIKELKQEAEALRKEALVEFEKEIFEYENKEFIH